MLMTSLILLILPYTLKKEVVRNDKSPVSTLKGTRYSILMSIMRNAQLNRKSLTRRSRDVRLQRQAKRSLRQEYVTEKGKLSEEESSSN
jgi:hypothetical protein